MTEIETASERGNASRGSGRGRSKLPAEKPDVGLDPSMLGVEFTFKKLCKVVGHLGGSVIRHLPSAQGMIPGLWDPDLSRR